MTDFNNCNVDSIIEVLGPNQIIADFITISDFGREILFFQADKHLDWRTVIFWDLVMILLKHLLF